MKGLSDGGIGAMSPISQSPNPSISLYSIHIALEET
jgi:hypothetical protein